MMSVGQVITRTSGAPIFLIFYIPPFPEGSSNAAWALDLSDGLPMLEPIDKKPSFDLSTPHASAMTLIHAIVSHDEKTITKLLANIKTDPHGDPVHGGPQLGRWVSQRPGLGARRHAKPEPAPSRG